MGIRSKLTELARNALNYGLDKIQAGPRSAQSLAMNYNSVTTLDPSRLATAFAAADQGYITDQATLFELVEEHDAHIFSELAKRRRAVTGLGWQLTPPVDANQSEIDRVAELKSMLLAIPKFEDAQYDLTDAIGKGIAALEIDWRTGSEWLPRGMLWVPQRMFQVDSATGELLYLKDGMPEPLRPWGWVVHEHRAKSGYLEQSALFRVLSWTYAYKAYNVKDMQRFLEVYGMPLRLGKYPSGITDKQRNELLRAVRNIGNDGAGVVPTSMEIEFIEAKNTGRIDDFLSAIEYWERKQSMAILGGTLTSQADGKTSTNALGLVHDKVRREIMLHDVRQIAPTINMQLIQPIALVNGMFPPDRMPTFSYDTAESVDQEKMGKVLSLGAEMGMEIGVDYAHNLMQIPRAANGEKILVAAQSVKTKPDAAAALSRLVALSANAGKTDENFTGAFSSRLAMECAPHEQQLIQQIASILSESGDFDEAVEKIEQLRGADPKWAETIAQGMAAANLAGRSEVE